VNAIKRTGITIIKNFAGVARSCFGSGDEPRAPEICASVKRLGYGAHQSVRLYGEELEVISDSFLQAGGFAVRVNKHERPKNSGSPATRNRASDREKAERSLTTSAIGVRQLSISVLSAE
jgi:hypothetical protein